MENEKLKSLWFVWNAAHKRSPHLQDRLIASDVCDLMKDLFAEKVTNACLKDATTNPETELVRLLTEIGIPTTDFGFKGGRR